MKSFNAMPCPGGCGSTLSKVVDKRNGDKSITRRRECLTCHCRWSTNERLLGEVSPPANGHRSGSQHPHAKLDEAKVIQIKELLSRGEKCEAIAAEFAVGKSAISSIKRGINWRKVS